MPPLSSIGLRRSVSLRIHFPASLGSTVVTRFVATTDALTPAGRLFGPEGHEHRLSPAGLPDYLAGPTDHSVSNHRRDDRGPPGCPALRRLASRPLYRLRHSLEGSPIHADRIEFTATPTREACVTDWSFSFRCSPPRLTATRLRFDTSRLFAARERTLTVLFPRPLRRTSADIPVRLVRRRGSCG